MEADLVADVAVVGAGLAGLTAARRLRESGLEVLVLEARDRVGGRTLNHPIGGGKVVELGGQWIGPGQDRVLALIGELGLETFPTHSSGRHIFEHRGHLHRHRGRIPFVPSLGLLEGYIALLALDWMARRVPPRAPWSAPRATEWDMQTVETWGRRWIRTSAGRGVIAMVCEAVWAADPADVSLLHLLAYINAAGGVNRLIETDGGAQETRIVGGSQQIALAMAHQLEDSVLLGEPVQRIEQTPTGVSVKAAEVTVTARRAIVAMSPALAGRLTYSPALPAERDQLTQRAPNGSVIKCMAVYAQPFWRGDGLSGQVSATSGPVKVVFDNSPPDGEPGVLLAFLEGGHARTLARRSAEERQTAVLSCLAQFFGAQAARPRDYLERNWSEDEWTRGCYGAFLPPNTWTTCGAALRAPVGRVHWAGAETATAWMGYMDGAIRSGEDTASEVREQLSVEVQPA